MNEGMNEDTEGPETLLQRLRAMGQRPVDPVLAAAVMGRVRRRASWWRSTRLKVASAAAGGLLLGSVGLASAGTLPRPVQDVAHDALGAVGVGVPVGTARYNDPTACPGGPYKNHGAYVKAHLNDPAAPDSPCGKPVSSVGKTGSDDGTEVPDGNGNPNANGGNGNGNGNGKANANASPNGKANSAKNKNKDKAADGDDGDDKPGSATAPNAVTTTTAPPAPSTTTAPATTTTTAAPSPTTTAPSTTTTSGPTTTTTAS
jgi:hypothetical protein